MSPLAVTLGVPLSDSTRLVGPHLHVQDYRDSTGVVRAQCNDCNAWWREGGYFPEECGSAASNSLLPHGLQQWRRVRKVFITSEVFLTVCRGRFEVVENAIPANATKVAAGYSVEDDAFVLYIEHESFDLVPWYATVPTHPTPIIKRIEP